MANTLFNLLDYSFTPANANVIISFSNNTTNMMNTISFLIPEWGYNDIKDQNVSNYLANPVSDTTNSILSIVESISTTTSNVPNLLQVTTAANNCINATSQFFQHTQRLSGLDTVNANTAELPHYETGIGIGKIMAFMTHQADGIANSATILGSFTSILVQPELTDLLSTIVDYPDLINGSITYNPMTFQMVSNLSTGSKQQISNTINNITTFVTTRREHDENFYTNSRTIVDQFNVIKKFTRLGETETYLIQNYLGTEKLLSRINT